MATQFTLDDVRAAAERSYGTKNIELGDGVEVALTNPLRLSKTNRDKLAHLQDGVDADADPLDFFVSAFEIVAGKAGASKIKKALGDDVALYMALFELYSKESEVGEASPSQG